MRRYYFQLVNERYEEFEVFIPDGSHKSTAENRAKAWMRENNVQEATLVVNSMATSNILDMIPISVK